MINQNIISEWEKEEVQKKDDPNHKIFDSLRTYSLEKLHTLLQEKGKNVIYFPHAEYLNAIGVIALEMGEEIPTTRKYVAAKILSELQEKYPTIKEWCPQIYLDVFQRGDSQRYKKNPDSFYTIDQLYTIVEDIKLDRLHLIIEGAPEHLCNAIAPLLKETTPFSVSIYSDSSSFAPLNLIEDGEKQPLENVCPYTLFKGNNEGVTNYARTMLKKKRKQKRKKKDEKVQ
jgi:hypothetical protein